MSSKMIKVLSFGLLAASAVINLASGVIQSKEQDAAIDEKLDAKLKERESK